MINALYNAISGIFASQKRLDISAQNIANSENTGSPGNESGAKAYKAQTALQTPLVDQNGQVIGTKTSAIDKNPPTRTIYNPGSPDADDTGYVEVSNFDFVEEALNISLASIGFKANAEVINAVQDLSLATIDLLNRR